MASESREERVADLIRAGQKEMTGEDVGDYFAPDFAFHGPGGFDADYEGLQGYFAAVRAAFDDLNIRRGIIVAEGDYIACQTWISGTFVGEFTQSPVGPLQPNGERVTFELMNIFRYDDQGRIAEEWIQIDNRSLLRHLAQRVGDSAPRPTVPRRLASRAHNLAALAGFQIERRMGTSVRIPKTARLISTNSILARSRIDVIRPARQVVFAGRELKG